MADSSETAGAGEAALRYRRIHIIVNPAAGLDLPILRTFNQVFGAAGIDWDVSITHRAGDARRQAAQAAAAGVDLVAAYGGDGTVMEAASGLLGSETPLAVLPGGTANVFALELGVPPGLAEACALICGEAEMRAVDIGQAGDQHFLVRIGCGIEAAMIEGADREAKNRLGWLAYALAAFQALREPPFATYRVTLDGEVVEHDGVTCIVANCGLLGRMGVALAPGISVSDGLLDVIIVRQADLASLLAMIGSAVAGGEPAAPLLHWQARAVVVEAMPAQAIQCDGEMIGYTPIGMHLAAHKVRVLAPRVEGTTDRHG